MTLAKRCQASVWVEFDGYNPFLPRPQTLSTHILIGITRKVALNLSDCSCFIDKLSLRDVTDLPIPSSAKPVFSRFVPATKSDFEISRLMHPRATSIGCARFKGLRRSFN